MQVSAASIYVSAGETTGFTIAQRAYADTFDDFRRNGFDPYVHDTSFDFQTFVRPTGSSASSTVEVINLPSCGSRAGINVSISARNYTGADPRGQLIAPALPDIGINAGITLQDGAVYPSSLYNTPFW